jgi:hypothetical protein
MEVDAQRAFAPVKNASGEARDTPETVQAQMIGLHTQWLTAASVRIEPGTPVEISPLFSIDQDDLLARQREGLFESELHVTQPRFFC